MALQDLVKDIARKSIEMMYSGTCDVIEHQKVVDPITHKTAFADVPIILGQPCQLSYQNIPTTSDGNVASVTQQVKLFVAPECDIKDGCKIVVTQNGKTTAFQNSGQPAVYITHQEIDLKLFERWA